MYAGLNKAKQSYLSFPSVVRLWVTRGVTVQVCDSRLLLLTKKMAASKSDTHGRVRRPTASKTPTCETSQVKGRCTVRHHIHPSPLHASTQFQPTSPLHDQACYPSLPIHDPSEALSEAPSFIRFPSALRTAVSVAGRSLHQSKVPGALAV